MILRGRLICITYLACMVLVVVLWLAGCGSSASSSTTATQTAISSCAYQANDFGLITVETTGNDCGQLLQVLASFGEVWTPAADPAAPDGQGTPAQVICSLTDGPATMVVRIAGGDQFDAETICSTEEQGGWQPS